MASDPDSGNPEIIVHISDNDWLDVFPDAENCLTETLQMALFISKPEMKGYEASIVLADDTFVHHLNLTYRGKDKPTNVLSFPENSKGFPVGEELPLGDVILALETIQREAAEQHKTFRHHVQHLVVHGGLHLLGYDHEEDKKAEEMEALEIKICEELGLRNPYEDRDVW